MTTTSRRAGPFAVALVLLTVGLAGCVGTGDQVERASDGGTTGTAGTPWQAGLADTHPTPDVAEERSREDRRANLAEPGDPRFAQFDAAFEAFMASHGIPTGQVAVMYEGELRYTRGYGYADRAGTQPANASTMFRLASITKPMTAAVVTMQVEQGLYNWTDPVFCVPPDPAPSCRLPIQPHPSFPVQDDRLARVQVEHLLAHEGGWGYTGDQYFYGQDTVEVANDLGIPSPPPAWRIAQYVMGEPIPYEPGEVFEYCNLCYMLAGLVAEAATGADLGALYEAYLFRPLEVSGDIEPGFTRPEERNPREPFYACEYRSTNVFEPNETVCWPDGGSSQRTRLAQGGLIATAEAVAAVYEVYAEHGFRCAGFAVACQLLPAGPVSWEGHGGGVPGTATMAGVLTDEAALVGQVQYVALFNKMGMNEPYYPASAAYMMEPPLLALTAAWGATVNGDGDAATEDASDLHAGPTPKTLEPRGDG